MKKLITYILVTIITLSFGINISFADDIPADSLKEATFDVTDILKLPGDDQPLSYFKNESPIVGAILMVIEFATRIIGILAVILLIIAGFMFMTAQGNQQGIDNAKDVVKYAVIGLVVTFLSYVIITFIQSLFTQ